MFWEEFGLGQGGRKRASSTHCISSALPCWGESTKASSNIHAKCTGMGGQKNNHCA